MIFVHAKGDIRSKPPSARSAGREIDACALRFCQCEEGEWRGVGYPLFLACPLSQFPLHGSINKVVGFLGGGSWVGRDLHLARWESDLRGRSSVRLRI